MEARLETSKTDPSGTDYPREQLAHRADQGFEGIHFVAVDDAKRLRHPPEEFPSLPVTQVGIRLQQTGATKPGGLRLIPALVALAYRVAPMSVRDRRSR